MAYRTRIKYTAKQKADIWDRWQRGESLNAIGRLFDRPSASIFNMLAPTGGIRPPLDSDHTSHSHSQNVRRYPEGLRVAYPCAR